MHLIALDVIDGSQRVQQAFGDAGGVAGCLEVVDQQQELIAAEAAYHVARFIEREGIGGAQFAPQALRDLPQEFIAGFVSEGVVDELEPIEVQEHHRKQGLLTLLYASDRFFQPIHEQCAVREPRQLVTPSRFGKLRLHCLAMRNVLNERPGQNPAGGVLGADAADQHGEATAVLATVILS